MIFIRAESERSEKDRGRDATKKSRGELWTKLRDELPGSPIDSREIVSRETKAEAMQMQRLREDCIPLQASRASREWLSNGSSLA